MPVLNTSIETKGIGEVLSLTRHQVPVHQRSFEWTEEVQEFLDDVGGAFRSKEEYFLGSLVVKAAPEDKRTTVLDGQQRLAVIALVIASIADFFKDMGEDETYQEIRRNYLSKYDIAEKTWRPQLNLNQTDDVYFRSILNREACEPEQGAPESHGRLWKANQCVISWMSEKLKNVDNTSNWLAEFIRYITESAYVVYFKVPDEANAYLIFETMNDRGLDLSIADLLKNYLLGHADEDWEIVLNLWTTAIASLAAYGGENLFTVFLRHFWNSRHGLVREKELHRSIKSRVSTSANVMDFANQLANDSYLYTAILSPEHEFWSEASSATREYLRTLGLFGLEQYRPMLLSALVHLQIEELEKMLKLLVSWSVRLLIVGGLGHGFIENSYCTLGQEIRKGGLKGVREIASHANKTFVPSDAIFQESFNRARVSKAHLARYYLRKLELEARGVQQPEQIPNIDPSELTLEHVLPEKPPNGSWTQFSEEDRKAYTKRLGNMLLLTQKMNSKIRGSPFGDKRDIYSKSDLLLSKEVAQFSDWDIESIEKRQKRLAELAVKAWRIKP